MKKLIVLSIILFCAITNIGAVEDNITPNITPNSANIAITSTVIVTATPALTIAPNSTAPKIIHIKNSKPVKKYSNNNNNTNNNGSTPTITTNSTSNDGILNVGFFGKYGDKIILAVILGFIGLSFEFVRINYEHKKRNNESGRKKNFQNFKDKK